MSSKDIRVENLEKSIEEEYEEEEKQMYQEVTE